MIDDIEPLEPVLWFTRIEMIARGELGCLENSLRHAAHLLQLTPRSLRQHVSLSTDEEAFEALLEAGDFDTAARHLVARPTALSVEAPGPDVGPVTATIMCSVLDRTITGSGASVASAILDAWTTCLLALRTELGADLARPVEVLQRAARSGQHGRSPTH